MNCAKAYGNTDLSHKNSSPLGPVLLNTHIFTFAWRFLCGQNNPHSLSLYAKPNQPSAPRHSRNDGLVWTSVNGTAPPCRAVTSRPPAAGPAKHVITEWRENESTKSVKLLANIVLKLNLSINQSFSGQRAHLSQGISLYYSKTHHLSVQISSVLPTRCRNMKYLDLTTNYHIHCQKKVLHNYVFVDQTMQMYSLR